MLLRFAISALLFVQLLLPAMSWAHIALKHSHDDHGSIVQCDFCQTLQVVRNSVEPTSSAIDWLAPQFSGDVLVASEVERVDPPLPRAAWPRGPPVACV